MFLEIVLETIKIAVICCLPNDFIEFIFKEIPPSRSVMYLGALGDIKEIKETCMRGEDMELYLEKECEH